MSGRVASNRMAVTSIEAVDNGCEQITLSDEQAFLPAKFAFGRIDEVTLRALAGTCRVGQTFEIVMSEPAS